MSDRFTASEVETWRREGGVLIPGFFTPDEVAAVYADFEAVYGYPEGLGEAPNIKKPGEVGRFNEGQFKTLDAVPLDCSPALNLIGVHPEILKFARAALKTPQIHLYQCQAWAKFTGAADYDQPFHCDFVNHTLTAPSEDETANSITILCYFTDVSEGHGPMHYVPRSESAGVAGPEGTMGVAYIPRGGDTASAESAARGSASDWHAMQAALRDRARTSAGPAGSIFPYSIDVFHRGTNMTVPGGRRYAVMTCFKAAGNEKIGFHSWAFHHMKPWSKIFNHATPDQLSCFGVPLPGDPFWTEVTIGRTSLRYPGWNAAPYRAALSAAA